ncbi:hypothetical protein PCANC_18485 [Puccinia coronata f. sp. avenae]|uniref:Uncharacterized protein n=1 Tax=Puccinia coronata f. sp. avenae TaxID=200324 RepID=A0A2N5T1E6_9BASI|nr:hypothetical protein PCANC_18485 [Puccinia coronata f. sp. avenae]
MTTFRLIKDCIGESGSAGLFAVLVDCGMSNEIWNALLLPNSNNSAANAEGLEELHQGNLNLTMDDPDDTAPELESDADALPPIIDFDAPLVPRLSRQVPPQRGWPQALQPLKIVAKQYLQTPQPQLLPAQVQQLQLPIPQDQVQQQQPQVQLQLLCLPLQLTKEAPKKDSLSQQIELNWQILESQERKSKRRAVQRDSNQQYKCKQAAQWHKEEQGDAKCVCKEGKDCADANQAAQEKFQRLLEMAMLTVLASFSKGNDQPPHCQKIWLGWLHPSLYWMRPSNSNLGARHRVNR